MSLPRNPQSRNEAILMATIDGTEYTAPPRSRIEALLIELKEAVEQGGGGGGTSDYEDLTNKPSINNVTLEGDTSLAELGLAYVYKAAGERTVAQLTSALLVEDYLGHVYNLTDSGTTTADFVEGAGHALNVGDNVVVVDVGTENSPVYKFDMLAGSVEEGIILTGTLAAGSTSITLSSLEITTDDMFDVYTDVFGINPTNISVVNGAITLTFEEQAAALGVKVVIR